MNYYELLQISKNASQSDITKAYRKTALRWHPDRCGDEKMFLEVKKAYETLSDPTKKSIYDKKFKNKDKDKDEIIKNVINDPNLGKVWDAPPPATDIWGKPIKKTIQLGSNEI